MVANTKGIKAVPKAESAMNKALPQETAEIPIDASFSTSLAVLATIVQSAHCSVSELRAALEPVLPQHMFDNSDEGSCKESVSPYRPTNGADLSPTLILVNIQLNEIDRLITRINYIRQQLVL
jgi:hypothetical protein